MPVTRPLLAALASAAGRELLWDLHTVSREVSTWRRRALAIADPAHRRDALDALRNKRGHTDGAAFFGTLVDRRDPNLLRTLIAYELLLDYLDGISERSAACAPERSRGVYLAAVHALDLSRPPSPAFGLELDQRDGGYLASLVGACRDGCRGLAAYDAVGPLLAREAERTAVLGLNHEPDATRRSAELRHWAKAALPDTPGLTWYERTAAASGWLMTHALLALGADPATTTAVAERVHAAYFPWVGLAVTMLDSYVDQFQDRREGAHSYIAYYPTPAAAHARLRESIGHAASAVRALPNGERHAVLLACMIALYLSKDSARTPELRATTAEIAAAGGTLTRLLLPILRAWRVCNRQQRAT